MPEELKRALPTDDQGRPVITRQGGIGLVYDSRLDDPITRWAACLSRVTAVMEANPKGMLAHCIDSISVCPSDEGGDACCPQACIDKFKQEHASGQPEMEVLAKSFVEGTCVKGFRRPATK